MLYYPIFKKQVGVMQDKFLLHFSVGSEKFSSGTVKFFALGLVNGKELWPSQLSEFGLSVGKPTGRMGSNDPFVTVVPVWKVFISYHKETQKNFTSIFLQFNNQDSFHKIVFPWAAELNTNPGRRGCSFYFSGRFHIMPNSEAKKALATDSLSRKYMGSLYGLPVNLKSKLFLPMTPEEEAPLVALEDELIGRSAREVAVAQVSRRAKGRMFRGLKNGLKI
jgi:hypothetical protein